MKFGIETINGFHQLKEIPENLREEIGLGIIKAKKALSYKTEVERIVDYVFNLLEQNTKQVRDEVCEEIKESIESAGIKYLDFDADAYALDYDEFKDILTQIQRRK